MDFQMLNLLFRCSKKFSHDRVRSHDFTDTECMICTYIYSNKDCSQDQIAAALNLDKTTVAKAVGKLEKKELISRTRDTADKRRNMLEMTEEGTEKMLTLTVRHNDWLNGITECLSEEEKIQFKEYCIRLLQNIDKAVLDEVKD